MDRFIQYTGTGEVSFSLVATAGDCNTLLSTLIQKYCDIQTLIWTNKVPQNLSNTTRGFTEYEKCMETGKMTKKLSQNGEH